jgi:hypothetical protein
MPFRHRRASTTPVTGGRWQDYMHDALLGTTFIQMNVYMGEICALTGVTSSLSW